MVGNKITYNGVTGTIEYSIELGCYIGKINYKDRIVEFSGMDEDSLIKNFIYAVNELD